jgi:hypothetical protein
MVTVLDGVRLARFDSQFIFPRRVYAPGEYRVPIVAAGNSLLSSLFVPALDVGASLEVRYVQSTAGQPETEETFVTEHRTITAAATQADQTLATKIHDKAVAIATVTGGNVTFGVRATVVDQFATDLDAALKRDGQLANLALDKGLPIVVLNTTTGQYEVWEGEDGIPAVRLLGDVQVNLAALMNPVVSNVTMPDGVTEVTFPVPLGTRAYAVKSRSGAPFRLAFSAGGTNTSYLTTGAHEAVNLDTLSSITLYARSQRTSGDVLEILSWS